MDDFILRPAAARQLRTQRTSSRFEAVIVATALTALLVLGLGLVVPGTADATPGDPGLTVTWSRQSPSSAPPARLHAAMALDAATGSVALFGGRAGTALLADTWTWDGVGWTLRAPATSPPPMESASMAYDAVSRRVLLFGGVGSDGNATNGTWAWDGANWAALTPATSPSARSGAVLAPDPVNGVVLFGGFSAPGAPLGDTWSWNGATWAALTPATSPSPRGQAAATFDPARRVVVLFGGLTAHLPLNDTWTWDGAMWVARNTNSEPAARSDAALGYDPASQESILFGGTAGQAPTGDTWVWDGGNWSLSALGVYGPPARMGSALAGAPARAGGHLVLFGGRGESELADTWTLRLDPVSPVLPPPAGSTVPPTTVAGTTTSVAPPITSGPRPSPGRTTTTPVAPARLPAALDVTTHSVRQGALVTLSGRGFAPLARVTISFQSVRVVVTTVLADRAGNFSASVVVPASVAPGQHHIQAEGAGRSGGQMLLLSAPISITRPGAKHSWVLPTFMMALTILVAATAGIVLLAGARRPWRPAN